MDQHHPHQQHAGHALDMEQHTDPNLAQQYSTFYHQDTHDPQTAAAAYGMPFAHQMQSYDVVQQQAPPQRQLSASELHAMQFRNLSLMPAHHYPNPASAYPPSPSNLNLPLNTTTPPPPQSPSHYDPLSPPISGSDTSAEGIYASRNGSGASSPSSSRGSSLVHRNPLRYNPAPSASNVSGRRTRGRSIDSDDDERSNMMQTVQELAHTRKEATRRQRIEAEQRRRDELRDGYARLKDVLPVSNQKSSKVSLLERATNYIIQLDKSTRQMQTRLAALESEVQRLRSLNEKISLSVGSTPEAGAVSMHPMDRPLSPPPEQNNNQHSVGQVSSDHTRNNSGSDDDDDY